MNGAAVQPRVDVGSATRSCLYAGHVRHRRFTPVPHSFAYRLFMMYVDLDELPELFDDYLLWSARRPAPAWFRRADYLEPRDRPLREAVADEVERQLQFRPTGPIRLLTHLRYFGYILNPVSFYYCFDAEGERVEAILAEITNTPWSERHVYALGPDGEHAGVSRRPHRFGKAFHVSPFMPMDHEYIWRFSDPDYHLSVHMESEAAGTKVFDATLTLRREPITHRTLAGALVRHPFMTARVSVGIYWQALRLWLKRAPFHEHPRGGTE